MSSVTGPLSPSPSHLRLPIASIVTALLVVYGISTLTRDPRSVVDMATWFGIAAVVLTVAGMPEPLARLGAALERHAIRPRLLTLAVGLGIVTAARFAILLQMQTDFRGITVGLWLVAIGALIAALWRTERLAPIAWLATHRREAAALGALTGVGAALRFWQLGALPRIINGDEGLIGTWAQDIGRASGALTMPFAAMDGVGTLYLALMQQLFGVFGPTAFALRLLPAIAGTLAIPATYLFARRLIGARGALIAAIFLTFSHVHIHFSRTVAVSYIYATLFVPLALYLLLTGLERRSPLRLALSVLAVGLHINAYVDGWVWLVLLFLVIAAWGVVDRSIFRKSGVPLAMFGVALLVIVAPMVAWAASHPAEFFSRMAVDGTISSGWLASESEHTGTPQALLMAGLFGDALGTFTHRPFIDFYGIGTPTLDPVSAALWAIGLAIALWRTRDRGLIVLNGWFWGGLIALGPTTVPPSTYHYRLLVVLPAAAVLIGLAADAIWRRVPVALEWAGALRRSEQRQIMRAAALALALVFALTNVQLYYRDFVGACKYEAPATRQAGLLGKYLHGQPVETTTFVLPNPDGFRAGPYGSLDFLGGRRPITNLDAPLDARPSELSGPFEHGLIVAAVPDRAAELEQLEQWFPGGRHTAILDCGADALQLYEWRVPIELR